MKRAVNLLKIHLDPTRSRKIFWFHCFCFLYCVLWRGDFCNGTDSAWLHLEIIDNTLAMCLCCYSGDLQKYLKNNSCEAATLQSQTKNKDLLTVKNLGSLWKPNLSFTKTCFITNNSTFGAQVLVFNFCSPLIIPLASKLLKIYV